MKLDIFNHFFPKSFYDRMLALSPKGKDINKRVREVPSIVDLDERFRVMDKFDDYAQVICLPAPALETDRKINPARAASCRAAPLPCRLHKAQGRGACGYFAHGRARRATGDPAQTRSAWLCSASGKAWGPGAGVPGPHTSLRDVGNRVIGQRDERVQRPLGLEAEPDHSPRAPSTPGARGCAG